MRISCADDLGIRRIELRFDLSFDPPADSSCLMPRLPNPPAPGTLKDDMPVYLYVAVTDTGPGLTPKELELLFQRFSQVSPKTHTVFGGSGLGLFVCRKITELMGGRIEVTSEHGKGSTFRFFIEARTCQTSKRPASIDDVEMAEARPPIKRRHTATKMGFAGPGPKPHVLIVEDNLINQTVLARQLKHVGLTCEGEWVPRACKGPKNVQRSSRVEQRWKCSRGIVHGRILIRRSREQRSRSAREGPSRLEPHAAASGSAVRLHPHGLGDAR
jgi:CheY-like chemotaxis protein